MRRLGVVLCFAVLAVAGLSSGQGSYGGRAFKREGRLLTAVTVLDREEIERSSLMSLDEMLVELGKKGVKNSTPGFTPTGWSCAPDGPAWRCSGPATDAVHLSFRARGNYQFADRVRLTASYQGRSLYDQRIQLESLPLPEIKNDLQGVLDSPASYSPGGYARIRPLSDTYVEGTWKVNIDGESIPATTLDREVLEQLPPSGRDFRQFAFVVPGVVQQEAKISYTYDDQWGERLVDAPATDYAIDDPYDADCRPAINAAPAMAAVGEYICVCGCFPRQTSGYSLVLDGRPVGVGGASPWVTQVSLANVEVGAHTISWAPGSGGSGAVNFEAVAVGGSADAEVIQRGGSTNLEFFVNGTQSQVDMDIYTSSSNISIQGGNQQTATTSGGNPNDIQRRLWGNEVGPFNVGFSIGLPPCPCGSAEDQGPLDPQVRHPMSLAGQGTLDWSQMNLRLPVRFSSEDFLSLTPEPPIGKDPFRVDFRQLGLRADVGDFAPFTFEALAGAESYGQFSNIEVDEQGHLRSADVDTVLQTQFAVDYTESLPLQVGLRYEFGLEEWGFQGRSPDLGQVEFGQRPGAASRIVLENIGKNSDGTLLYGDASIELFGLLRVNPEF